MAETRSPRKAGAAKKKAATAKRKAATAKKKTPSTTTTRRRASKARARRPKKRPLDRSTGLSEEVAKSVEEGQRVALEAVHKFVDTVERALPTRGEGAPKRQEVVDSALEMADRLVQTQYDFLRKVVQSAGNTLGVSDKKK